MPLITRRSFMATAPALGALVHQGAGAPVAASPASASGDMSLAEALSKRRSTGLFSDAAEGNRSDP